MNPYLVTAWLKPTKKQADDGVAPKVVMEPKLVFAVNEQQASIQAARLIPQEVAMDRVEVAVMPFRS